MNRKKRCPEGGVWSYDEMFYEVEDSMKDWGDMDAEDKQTNEEALNYPDDLYVMGAYNTSKGRIWIITNRISEIAGDNATTVCFPEER